MKKAGVETKIYLQMSENDQTIKMASLDQFKRIVIVKDDTFQSSIDKKVTSQENSLRNAKECKKKTHLTEKHSALYCQVCFPRNIYGLQ